jgi:hypothetical protein
MSFKILAEDEMNLIKLLCEGRRAIGQAKTEEPKGTHTKIMSFKFMSVLMGGGRSSKAGEREKDPYEGNVTKSFMQMRVGGRSVQNERR